MNLAYFASEFARKERSATRFVECAGGQFYNSLSRGILRSNEVITIQLEKQNTDHESCALVTIEEWMIAEDTSRVCRRHVDEIGIIRVGV